MKFQKYLFGLAGAYGLVTLAPLYWLEDTIGSASPPALTHVEYFYGFVGLALAWQLAFFVIARNPARARPFMLAAVAEKLAFGVPAAVLYAKNRVVGQTLGFGMVDLALAAAFLVAYFMTPAHAK